MGLYKRRLIETPLENWTACRLLQMNGHHTITVHTTSMANSGGGSSANGTMSRYRAALTAISTRTGTALPSLVTSFAILHEVTAIIPFAGIFFGAHALGLGERVIASVAARNVEVGEHNWMQRKFLGWMDEGEHWAIHVGRRYGIWGFEKGQRLSADEERAIARNIAGDLANAVVAYGATKVSNLITNCPYQYALPTVTNRRPNTGSLAPSCGFVIIPGTCVFKTCR